MTEVRGFIVSAWDEFRGERGARMLVTGRLADGRSFAALRESPAAALFVARDRADAAVRVLGGNKAAMPPPEDWSDLAGAALARISVPRGSLRAAERSLAAAGITVAGIDRRRADEELAALGIRGPVIVRGEEVPGRRVDVVFVDPELSGMGAGGSDGAGHAGEGSPKLRWLALDIETDQRECVVAVSLAQSGKPGEVLFVQGQGKTPTAPGIEVFPDESSMLGALAARLVRNGWPVRLVDQRGESERNAIVAAGQVRTLRAPRPLIVPDADADRVARETRTFQFRRRRAA